MGIESIVICIDNTEWMRNGDFIPTRLHSQNDAVNMMARFKTKESVETNVGLLTFSDTQVRVPLTNDYNKISKHLQALEPKGEMKFIIGIRIAHLALKHRLNKNHKTRIVAFVASPITDETREIERLAKRLKKENVNVDVVSFGEADANSDKLSTFMETLNGGKEPKEGKTKCHLIQARAGTMLSDVLMNSPVMVGEDGVPIGMGAGSSGFDLSMDPMAADDPELAMALRVSLEEQRQRVEDETRRIQQESLEQMQTDTPVVQQHSSEGGGGRTGTGTGSGAAGTGMLAEAGTSDLPFDENMQSVTGLGTVPEVSSMSEEEQLALAIQMSMNQEQGESMETDTTDGTKLLGGEKEGGGTSGEGSSGDKDMEEMLQNTEFLHSVLSSLPGVNPEEAMENLKQMSEAVEDQKEKQKKDEGDSK